MSGVAACSGSANEGENGDGRRAMARAAVSVHAGQTRFIFFEFGRDQRMHELLHVAAEDRDLAHQRRRNEGELFLRREEHGFEIARCRCRLMFASWNSNSKSDTARRPRTTTCTPCSRAKSTVRPL